MICMNMWQTHCSLSLYFKKMSGIQFSTSTCKELGHLVSHLKNNNNKKLNKLKWKDIFKIHQSVGHRTNLHTENGRYANTENAGQFT